MQDLATIFHQVNRLLYVSYPEATARQVHRAIRAIFGDDARMEEGGVYVYLSDEEPRRVLYVGETNSFEFRFDNHNLSDAGPGNRKQHVDAYFAEKPGRRLLLVLLCMDKKLLAEMEGPPRPLESKPSRRALESALRAAEFRRHGSYPAWSNEAEREERPSDEVAIEVERLMDWMCDEPDSTLDYPAHDLLQVAAEMEERKWQCLGQP